MISTSTFTLKPCCTFYSIHTFPCRVVGLGNFPLAFLLMGIQYPQTFSLSRQTIEISYSCGRLFHQMGRGRGRTPNHDRKSKTFLLEEYHISFWFTRIFVFDNGTQFTSSSLLKACKHLDIQNQFTSVEHPHANGQVEAGNKVFMSRMRKNLDEPKWLCVEYLHEILWSYHTTPHSTTKETPFRMVYGVEAIIPVESLQ